MNLQGDLLVRLIGSVGVDCIAGKSENTVAAQSKKMKVTVQERSTVEHQPKTKSLETL